MPVSCTLARQAGLRMTVVFFRPTALILSTEVVLVSLSLLLPHDPRWKSHGTRASEQITEDERAMPGAPQGQIFEVTVLERSDLPVSGDVPKDVEVRACQNIAL